MRILGEEKKQRRKARDEDTWREDRREEKDDSCLGDLSSFADESWRLGQTRAQKRVQGGVHATRAHGRAEEVLAMGRGEAEEVLQRRCWPWAEVRLHAGRTPGGGAA